MTTNRYLTQFAACETAAQAVRFVESLADVHDDEALAALLHVAAYSPHDPLTRPAVRTLGQRGDRRALEPLRVIHRDLVSKALDFDLDAEIDTLIPLFIRAIVALLGTQERLDLLESKDWFERASAVHALAAEKNASETIISALLVRALDDPEPIIQREAATSLICLGFHADAHVDHFLEIFRSGAGQLPVAFLQQTLSDVSFESHGRACSAWMLGARRAESARDALQQACGDSNKVVAAQATWGLKRLLTSA